LRAYRAADPPVHHFLLIRLGALGDVVHAIPVAAALRRAFPSARIDWLVSAKHREILDLVPVIDRRLVVNDRGDGTGGAPLIGSIAELRRQRYDVAIDLQGLLKSAVLARSSGAPRVLGFSSRYLRERLARPFYTEVYHPGGAGMYDPAETTHITRVNLGLLGLLGLSAPALEFPIEPVDSVVARELRDGAGGRYMLLNPGAAWPNKRWPPSRLGAVARAIYAQHRLPSIVLWGPGEEPLAREVVAASGAAATLSPRTSIADLVALVRGASLMVSGDTGPAHIASALGTPLVGIYGPTRPARNGPWSPYDVTVSRDAVCECHHLRRCRRDTMCLEDIQVDEVLGAIERRLAVESTGV
jgi:lipopolysaccharide heptosyltransferase I